MHALAIYIAIYDLLVKYSYIVCICVHVHVYVGAITGFTDLGDINNHLANIFREEYRRSCNQWHTTCQLHACTFS